MNVFRSRRAPAPVGALLIVSLPLALGAFGYTILFPPDSSSAWNAATAHPDRIVLTWSGDPSTSQSVTWRTDATGGKAFAQIALASAGPGFAVNAHSIPAETRLLDTRGVGEPSVAVRYHSATFSELQPDTIYAYRVGDGEQWSEWFHFRTASEHAKPFSFIYLGDAQNDIAALSSRMIRGGFAQAPDARFVMHAGDLVNDANDDEQWGEWFMAGGWIYAMVPTVPAAGNHEYRVLSTEQRKAGIKELSRFWKAQFTLPTNGIEELEETNFWFDYQGARLVVLNSNEQLEAQASWLDSTLGRNPQRWTIVMFHHPVFSSAKQRDNAKLRALWKPVFEKHGVDLVLQGHDHTYARGHSYSPANGSVAPGSAARERATGPVYVVSVTGRKMYTFKPEQWDGYEATLDRRAENLQLFQVVRISNDTLRFEAFTATGALYDSFELIGRGDTNWLVERVPAAAPTHGFDDAPAYRW